jgi:Tfp pilus assembly PilM family ATPase
VARRDIIESYERACEAAGAYAGIVDLATVNLINAVLGTEGRAVPSSDWLLVHTASDYSTLAVIRGPDVIFFRTRPSERDDDLADLVHQTAMYYEDRLSGRGFGRVLVAGATNGPDGAAGAEGMRRALEERLGARVEAVDPRGVATLTDRIGASPDLLDRLAPLVGILMREPAA